jgi:hypothetical protein
MTDYSILFKNWKQPIPTNLDAIFGEDYLAQQIFIFALLHATNEEWVVNRNGKFTKLQRGQCYATITHLAKRFNRDRETISKALDRLATTFNALHNDIDHFGVVMTIQSYDEIIRLPNETNSDTSMNPQPIPNDSPTTPQPPHINKSVNNGKNINNSHSEFALEEKKLSKAKYPTFDSLNDTLIQEKAKHWNISLEDCKKVKYQLGKYAPNRKQPYKDFSAALDTFIENALTKYKTIQRQESWADKVARENPNIV